MLTDKAKVQDIVSTLQDLQAINQKSELKSVVGSSSDTTMGQIIELTNAKNKITDSLNAKNIAANGNDSFMKLAEGVESISIKGMGGFGAGDEIGIENLNLSTMPLDSVDLQYNATNIKSVADDEKGRLIVSCDLGSYSYLMSFIKKETVNGAFYWQKVKEISSSSTSFYGKFFAPPNSDYVYVIVNSISLNKINKDTLATEAQVSSLMARFIEDITMLDESTLVVAGNISSNGTNLSLAKLDINTLKLISRKDNLPNSNYTLRLVGNRYAYTRDSSYLYLIDLTDFSYKVQAGYNYLSQINPNSSSLNGVDDFTDGDYWYVFNNTTNPPKTTKHDLKTLSKVWESTEIYKGIIDYNKTHFKAFSHTKSDFYGTAAVLVDKDTLAYKDFAYNSVYPAYVRYYRYSKLEYTYASDYKLKIPVLKLKVR